MHRPSRIDNAFVTAIVYSCSHQLSPSLHRSKASQKTAYCINCTVTKEER